MHSLSKVRLVLLLLASAFVGLSGSAMTKPFPTNTTSIAPSTTNASIYVNPWASGPCYAPGTTASTFCSCSKLYDALAQLQTVTTTGTPPGGGLVWTDTFTMSTITEKSYTPPMACCSKTCEIYASSVQIIYWHVDLNTMNASITTPPASSPYSTVAGNFTYISPSVYVAYHGLNAHYDCGYFSSFTTGAVYDTTIGYPPDALSTYVGPLWMKAQTGPEPASLFQAINYTEFQQYEANTANEGYSKNLKIPSDLAAIDPAWNTCTPGMYGSWDPPRVLTAARNMVAPTPAQPDIDPSKTATPAAGIAPTHLPATATPPPKDPTNEPLESDPPTASADPDSEPKDPQSSKGTSDPAWSVGPADTASQGNIGGEAPMPAAKQGQDSDPADPQDSPPKISPNPTSPGASENSLAAGGSSADNTNNGGVSGPGLNVDPPDSPSSPKSSEGIVQSPLSFNPVVLASPSPLTVGGNTVKKAPSGGAVIGKSTYTAGYQGQISSMSISVGVDKVVIGSTTHVLPTSTAVLIGGDSIVKAANGGVVIGTSTYSPGSEVQISDTALSVGVDSVVVGGTSYAIPTYGTAEAIPVNKSPISRAPNGGAIFQGNTIGLGSQSTYNGHTLSVGASTVVLDGTSYALPSSAGAVLQSPYPQIDAPVTLGNGAVLTPGGAAATFSGTAYAITSDDSGLVVNGQTVSFPTETTLQSVFTVADQTFTAAPTGFIIGSQSVSLDGTAAMIDGTVVSLGPSGVQIGSKTMPLTSAQTTEGSLGGLIMSGFGSGVEPAAPTGGGNGSSVLEFTGGSSRVRRRLGGWMVGTVMGIIALLV